MPKSRSSLFAFALSFIGLCFVNTLKAQVQQNQGNIEVNADFKEVIILTVNNNGVAGAQVNFVVDDVEKYRNGVVSASPIQFSVASSIDFNVDMSTRARNFVSQTTAFQLPSNNFGIKISATGNHQDGQQLSLQKGTILLGNGGTIIRSFGSGNAGDDADNLFQLDFELGTQDVQDAQSTKLGTLLSQNIPPATYTNTVILNASAAVGGNDVIFVASPMPVLISN